MKTLLSVLALVAALGYAIVNCNAGCSRANVAEVRAHAAETFAQAGFAVIGDEGYELGGSLGGTYGGAVVWFTLRREPDNGITYHAGLQRWGNEYHIYNLRAIDAIKPR